MATAIRTSDEKQQRAEALRQMKNNLYNVKAAEQVRLSLKATPSRFNADSFLEYVADHPVLSKLHLVSNDDE